MNSWYTEYNGHQIRVRNKTLSLELYVDGRLVDRQKGLTSSTLFYKLPVGDVIRVVANITLVWFHCSVYVNDVKIFSNN
jgi:hypothetical protein